MSKTSQPISKGNRNKVLADAVSKAISLWYPSVNSTINSMRLAMYTTEHLFEGSVVPAMQAVVAMQEQCAHGLVGAMRGEQTYPGFASDTWSRLRSGVRFNRLVNTLGLELFGSARLPGETVIDETEFFKLTYIPPKQGVRSCAPLFHVGGSIPYGDRIFRVLPEASFYERFTERGMPVYAMELRGDRHEVSYRKLTLSALVDSTERMTTKAFAHAGRKLVLEGYCGQGMQSLAWLSAMPEQVQNKIAAVALFVTPVHGPACTMISQMPQLTSSVLADAQLAAFGAFSGYVPGFSTRLSLDLALKKNFIKTPLGRFYDGWCQSGLSHTKTLEQLSASQRKVLAGAYWISPANANRFPIPVDLGRYANAMFATGLSKTGEIPFSHRGKALSLGDFAKHTNIPVFGFYGGTDPVIIDRTAYPLMGLLGSRYHHVVHPNAGHISYIFSAEMWSPDSPRGLKPNPIDALIHATEPSATAVD